jgi:hypothetical protein
MLLRIGTHKKNQRVSSHNRIPLIINSVEDLAFKGVVNFNYAVYCRLKVMGLKADCLTLSMFLISDKSTLTLFFGKISLEL